MRRRWGARRKVFDRETRLHRFAAGGAIGTTFERATEHRRVEFEQARVARADADIGQLLERSLGPRQGQQFHAAPRRALSLSALPHPQRLNGRRGMHGRLRWEENTSEL